MRFRIAILIGLLLAFAGMSGAAEETPLLAHSPTVSQTQIVFAYGGYLWSVPRDGGDGAAAQLDARGAQRAPGAAGGGDGAQDRLTNDDPARPMVLGAVAGGVWRQ